MYIVLIAWLFVTLLMAVAEATSPIGTVLGALITFMLYGALPMGLLAYLMATPARRRARVAREALEAREMEASGSGAFHPDAGGKAPAPAEPGTVAPVREEP